MIEQMTANGTIARAVLERFVAALPSARTPSQIDTVLDHALITAPISRDPVMLARLGAIMARVLD